MKAVHRPAVHESAYTSYSSSARTDKSPLVVWSGKRWEFVPDGSDEFMPSTLPSDELSHEDAIKVIEQVETDFDLALRLAKEEGTLEEQSKFFKVSLLESKFEQAKSY